MYKMPFITVFFWFKILKVKLNTYNTILKIKQNHVLPYKRNKFIHLLDRRRY